MTKSLSLLVATLLSAPGSSFAYVSSASSGTVRTPTFLPEQKITSQKRPTYDLGLGRNPPVIGKPKPATTEGTTTYDAAQFWMIPEAVHNYPSPLMKAKKRKPQQVIPSRMASDAVDISGRNSDAKAVLQVKSVDLEMNTLWVEMLIHQQQQTMVATSVQPHTV